jgi:hypothetical protein
MEPTMILVGFVVGRFWVVPLGAVAAAIAISAPPSLLSSDFALGLLVGGVNTAVGVTVRSALRHSARWLRQRRSRAKAQHPGAES